MVGVNVYWKTKGYDPNRGRHYTSVAQARLPRCPYSEERQCSSGWTTIDGTSEHLEGLTFSATGSDKSIKTVSKANRITRFFNYRYLDKTIISVGDNDEKEIPDPNGKIDDNVQLGVVFFTQKSDSCVTEFCGGHQGTFAEDYDYSQIYIPTNDLEYLVIEVMGFEYANNTMWFNDVFYTFPVFAVKYVPTGEGKKMKIYRSGSDTDRSGEMSLYTGFPRAGATQGYWDSGNSNVHGSYQELDFENIDVLDVKLVYNRQNPAWEDAQGRGIQVNMSKNDLTCDLRKQSCAYPSLKSK